MMLPEEQEACYPGAIEAYEQPCEEDEFHCGGDQCVHGSKLCDNVYDCPNGADELKW
jgi:hypothetical protein